MDSMTQPSMTTSETLNRAADLIEERGWATGNCGMAVTGPTCLEGALAATIGIPVLVKDGPKCTPNDLEDGAEFYGYCAELDAHAAYRAMADYLGRRVGALFAWNDYQTSAAPVVEALRAAALIEAAKETAADPLVAHLVHHAVDIIAAELDQTAPLADVAVTA